MTTHRRSIAVGKGQTFGALVRETRHAARIPLRTLASWTGLSRSYLSEIERELRHPPPLSHSFYERAASALRIDLDELRGLARRGREALVEGTPWRKWNKR